VAVTTIRHQPSLTAAELRSIFERDFPAQGKGGEIVDFKGFIRTPIHQRDFMVRRSSWVAAGIALKQEPSATKIVYTGVASSAFHNVLFNFTFGIGALLFWNGLIGDIRKFIETHPQLGGVSQG
jgi:hypothetical protein